MTNPGPESSRIAEDKYLSMLERTCPSLWREAVYRLIYTMISSKWFLPMIDAKTSLVIRWILRRVPERVLPAGSVVKAIRDEREERGSN